MAIYQEARPITFEQVVGQEHIKDVLMAALNRARMGHAYLFSGPRGVGKTTTARLIAMAVNCERDGVQRPCGGCESCLLVRQASHPDVIELDAASNNSVEDIRELREKVNLAAVRGHKRVWILDEAHMLSKSAANALLKTLEEPPSHLVFVLATTEPEKLPPTILSRCQHYRFRRLSEGEIASKLSSILAKRQVEAEAEALSLLARAADGAMRDGESLLERLLNGSQTIRQQDVEDALGLPPLERLHRLASALCAQDGKGLLEQASQLYRDGFAPRTIVERLAMTLRDGLLQSLGLAEHAHGLDADEATLRRLIDVLDDQSERFQRHNDLFALEVSLIKALNSLSPAPSAEVLMQAPSPQASPPKIKDFDPLTAPPRRPPNSEGRGPTTPTSKAAQTPPKPAAKRSWTDLKRKVSGQLKAFLQPAEVSEQPEGFRLSFPESHKFHFQQLSKRQQELQEVASEVFRQSLRIEVYGPGSNFTVQVGARAPTSAPKAAPPLPQEQKPVTQVIQTPQKTPPPKPDIKPDIKPDVGTVTKPLTKEETPKPTPPPPPQDPMGQVVQPFEEELPPDFWDSPDYHSPKSPPKARFEPIGSEEAVGLSALNEPPPLADAPTEEAQGYQEAIDYLQQLFPGKITYHAKPSEKGKKIT